MRNLYHIFGAVSAMRSRLPSDPRQKENVMPEMTNRHGVNPLDGPVTALSPSPWDREEREKVNGRILNQKHIVLGGLKYRFREEHLYNLWSIFLVFFLK